VLLRYGFAFLKHGSLWSYRLATWAVLAAGLLFVAAVLALRYWLLPDVDEFRTPIVRTLSQAVGQPLEIARLEGSWRGYRPELRLHGLKIMDSAGGPSLELERVDAVLSWVALLSGHLNFHSIEFNGVNIVLRRDPTGKLWVAGSAIEPRSGGSGGFAEWMLAQRQVMVRKARVSWTDELRGAPPLVVEDATLELENDASVHRIGLTGVPPVEVASPVLVLAEFTGGRAADLASWSGRLYAEFDGANLALLQNWVALPIHFDSGVGTLRLWIELAGGRIVSATADSNLVNVRTRLGDDLEPLALRNLSGRLTWRDEPGGFLVGGKRVGFTTADGVVLPAVDVELRRRGVRNEANIDGLELAPIVALAERLPFDPRIRERLAATSPAGRINGAKLVWQGKWDPAQPYSAQADLDSLQWRALGALPGVKGISGKIDADQSGGKLVVRAENGALELPRVFVETVPLDYLSGVVDWQLQDGRVSVNVRSAAFTNDHAAGNVSGSYISDPNGKGTVDFSGRLVRADARAVWRYVPRMASGAQRWLKRALVRGTADDVQFLLKGPLDKFPFRSDEGGRFEVVSKVRDVTLDYDNRWPPAEGLSATVAFRGASMEIEATAGRVLGIEAGRSYAAITDLGKRDQHLSLEIKGSGPLSDFLRFIEVSPVAGYTSRATAKMRASGEGKLQIDVDLPLRRAEDVKVAGSFDLSARELEIDPRAPTLTEAEATVEFSEKRVAIRDGRALLYGAPLKFSARPGKDGGMLVALAGRVDASALQRASDSALARQVAGATQWKGSLAMAKGISRLRIESSLAGLAIMLPAPFAKRAEAPLAFSLELLNQADGAEQVSVGLGELATARFALESGAISRGEIRFGGPAALPARAGLTLAGHLDEIDFDSWRQWSAHDTEQNGPPLSAVDLSMTKLILAARQFHNVRVTGEHGAGGWQFALEASEAAGTVTWEDGEAPRLTARLSTLVVPAPEPEVRPAVSTQTALGNLPSLEVAAQNFQFEGKDLGQLELSARPTAENWQLEKLRISNPDGRMDVTGQWLLTDPPSTELEVRIEAVDVGKLLGRLGYPEGIIGGKGSLGGPVKWRGAPYRVDVPSLGGQLRFEASMGRFAKVEPGVGKLLGILSLQAIPRRLTLDFRDVFSSGFSFDRISADVALAGGVARTQNFRMAGSAARVEMGGQVDLAAETQELKVRVLPHLSTGVAIAGAAVINPAVGVAALLAQKALGDPVEQMAAQDYQVSGTWSEPKVERLIQKIETASPRR
jgi:uncharacterized protein (TIGR02099 family)